MEYQQLGTTTIKISRIGFGCMSLPKNEKAAQHLLLKAVGLGINFFDTADLYENGQNEEIVGKTLSAHRKDVYLATKVGNQLKSDGTGWDWNPSKQYILQAANASLKRLKTDHIDLYQLHGGTIDDPIDEVVDAFETLKQQGKILYYGISSIRPATIREYLKKGNLSSLMVQYSLLDRRPEESIFEMASLNGLGILARGTIAKGLLAGKKPGEYLSYSSREVDTVARTVASISGQIRSASRTAIEFVLSNPAVSSAIVGIRTPEQLDDILGKAAEAKLSSAEKNLLSQSVHANYYESHR